SETTFILPPTDSAATVRLRSFTPNGSEVFGAGHNALGAWLWLVETRFGQVTPETGFAQQIGADVLPVEVSRKPDGQIVISMSQSAPSFGKKFTDQTRLADSQTRWDLAAPHSAQASTPKSSRPVPAISSCHSSTRQQLTVRFLTPESSRRS
ncbi:PhzF family phenazine biosynthesis protein, partial [Cryobacterium luteum]